MFFNFVDELRAAGIPASFKEHLTLFEALEKDAKTRKFVPGVMAAERERLEQRKRAAIDRTVEMELKREAERRLEEMVERTKNALSDLKIRKEEVKREKEKLKKEMEEHPDWVAFISSMNASVERATELCVSIFADIERERHG